MAYTVAPTSRLDAKRLLVSAPALALTAVAGICWLTAAGVSPFDVLFGVRPLALSASGAALTTVIALIAWTHSRQQRSTFAGFSWLVVCGLLPSLAAIPSEPGWLVSWLLATGPLSLVGALALMSPTPRLARVWTAIGLIVAASLLHAFAYQPFADPACHWTCTAVSAPLANWLGARNALGVASLFEVTALAAVLLQGLRSSMAPSSTRIPVAISCGLLVAADVTAWWRWGARTSTVLDDHLRSVGIAITTVAIAINGLRILRLRRTVSELVRQLSGPAGAEELAPIPGIHAVYFAVPGGRSWIDQSGDEVALEPTGMLVTGHDGQPALQLVLDEGLDPSDVRAILTPATRLILDNARLDVIARHRLDQIRQSQTRIVETSDSERHRIERDLHDGAQQRLVGVAMHLGLARHRTQGALEQLVSSAQREVQAALASLRDISHGELLGVLASEGLQAALEDLVAIAANDTDLRAAIPDSLTPSVERAIYTLVATALDRAAEESYLPVRVTLRGEGGLFAAQVTYSKSDAAPAHTFTDIKDRVVATGGILELGWDAGSVSVTGTWPCG